MDLWVFIVIFLAIFVVSLIPFAMRQRRRNKEKLEILLDHIDHLREEVYAGELEGQQAIYALIPHVSTFTKDLITYFEVLKAFARTLPETSFSAPAQFPSPQIFQRLIQGD